MRLTDVAELAHGRFDGLGDDRHAAGAVAVAEHQIGARTLVSRSRRRGHRVAIDQHGGAEITMQAHEHAPQCPMVGLVEAVNAPQRFGDRDALIVDFLRVADHARHRAETPRQPASSAYWQRRADGRRTSADRVRKARG